MPVVRSIERCNDAAVVNMSVVEIEREVETVRGFIESGGVDRSRVAKLPNDSNGCVGSIY